MICPHCGNETKEGAAFCSKCETQLNTPAAGIGQPAFNAANATVPHPLAKKPNGKLIAAGVAALIIVGVLFVNVLMPLISPEPWCVGTWYAAGVSRTGTENMIRVKDPNYSALVLDKDGSAEFRFAIGTAQCSTYTGTWEEDAKNGSKPHTVTISLAKDGSGTGVLATLVCNNPENAKSLSCLVFTDETDNVLVFCRDKSEVESSTWSISDLPSLDGLS